jgi:diguanylate cyclase (GGDEF)-like protein
MFKETSIFSGLNPREGAALLSFAERRHINRGRVLFRQGDPGDRLYVVLSGKMAVSVRLPGGEELKIEEFSKGNFFGEMSIFEDEPRSASCYCIEDADLLALEKNKFRNFIAQEPVIANKIMLAILQTTTTWLKKRSSLLSDLVIWDEEARRRVVTDAMTGLYNRRFLDEALEDHFTRARTYRKDLTLIMVDLDHFRDINNYYSTSIGDRVILSVCPVFKRRLRSSDVLARYGGDEFTFILPETGPDTAFSIADAIRSEVESLDILDDIAGPEAPVAKVTTSFGIASFPLHASDLPVLKKKADDALYRAKKNGRNCIMAAS